MRFRKGLQRFLSAFLAVLLVFSGVPATAQAEGTQTYQKISSADEFETGKYVMVTDTGYAPGVLDGTWVTADEVGSSPEAGSAWTITVDGNSATLQDANGQFIAPKGGNNNGIASGGYDWEWSENGGTFTFSGTGEDTVRLASNKGSENKFRAYKDSTVTGNPEGYPSNFTLYKLTESGSEPGGETTVAAPTADPQAGEVASGTAITLSTTTAEAQIYFTLDGSDPADAENEARQLYSEENKPVITADCTLKAVAVHDDSVSAVQEIAYTVAETETPGAGSPDRRRRSGRDLRAGL